MKSILFQSNIKIGQSPLIVSLSQRKVIFQPEIDTNQTLPHFDPYFLPLLHGQTEFSSYLPLSTSTLGGILGWLTENTFTPAPPSVSLTLFPHLLNRPLSLAVPELSITPLPRISTPLGFSNPDLSTFTPPFLTACASSSALHQSCSGTHAQKQTHGDRTGSVYFLAHQLCCSCPEALK